ncbi:ATP-dependent helicase [Rhodopirellula sallentina]|uniref:DNA 3'-5' helicase n=1 Tax=Rhodopirellula sallentina SM41 TaxID=1263870 RepID=M5UF53_9BACT|nr:UvrD-helicase domain-containing protein [Rhodopirellula sallentina]EMI54618.1 ATP-dependent DNA helicase PcrA [Rhodopirellula sallentina SM41]
MDAITKNLTAAQTDAVTHVDGPLLIIAGPGSGKTRVVTHRIAYMLQQGVRPWQIAALTFTNKAADEMRTRLNLLAPDQPVWMGTFHRFCAQQLRRYASFVGLSENYSIYDMADSRSAMKRAIQAAGVSTSHATPEQIASAISKAKNRLITPESMQQQSGRASDAVAARVYPVYQEQLLLANAVDFDDLLYHFARLLRENPEVRGELDAKLKYIMVDEYQDTNLAQYAIVRAMSVDNPNLAVTGDPDQSIYGWRGADLNNILDFEKDYPHVKTVRLEQNYRSTPNILAVADQLIRHNRRRKAKELYTDNPDGENVVLRQYQDGYEEADAIADEIASQMIAGNAEPRDFAIFCRMNALTRSLEHALRNRGLPYQIVNGVEFYQRKEVKDLLAYLHLINNPAHDVALQRIINTPARSIGATTLGRLQNYADEQRIPMLQAARQVDEIDTLSKRSKTMVRSFVSLYDRLRKKATESLEDLVRYLVEETKYIEYLERTSVEKEDANPVENVDEFLSAAVEFDRMHPEDGSLEAFLEQVALVSDTDKFEDSNNRVTLMTLHAAKGLEFPRVFVIGVEDDLLPHYRSKQDDQQLEEERRLLFVGITRAKQWLQLSYAKRRSMRGDFRVAIPSMFLSELPRADMNVIESFADRDFFDDSGDMDYPDSWDFVQEPAPEEEGEKEYRSDSVESSAVTTDPPESTETAVASSAVESPTGDASDSVSVIPDVYMDPPAKKKKPKSRGGITVGLTTASEMLSSDRVPLGAYREGSTVRHPDYGEGTIMELTGRGPKRTAKIRFADDDSEQTFRLAFAKLELVDAS